MADSEDGVTQEYIRRLAAMFMKAESGLTGHGIGPQGQKEKAAGEPGNGEMSGKMINEDLMQDLKPGRRQ
mgnify:CR=1 FL=1|jgi:hypothetical protein